MTINRGSEWSRWDVHIHTPGTALANEFPPDSWPEYIDRVNKASPIVVALGCTDYLSIRGYKVVREQWLAGELPGVRFVFPNIEFRVSPPTRQHKGVNFHLLVDPRDEHHVERIENALARLTFTCREQVFNCRQADLIRLGRTLNPRQRNDDAAYSEGVNAFKIDFSAFQEWFRQDPWLRKHCLVTVAGKERDGVSGLSPEHGYAATMDEMLRFADIVFSGNPTDRRYWLGEGADDAAALTERFGGPKPCLHGSDAHRLDDVCAPDEERFCWIRAEPTFDGLRQVVFEPRERVHIGPDRPRRLRQNWIRSVAVEAPWFPQDPIDLNEGLVAVIGPRGSGKTALADLIACGADAFDDGPASFLSKAMTSARGTMLGLSWSDRDEPETRVVGEVPGEFDSPMIRYLSQHFVEQLCSSEGASDRLIREIEQVVFDSLDDTERSDASSFDELRTIVTQGSIQRIQDLRGEIAECSSEVARLQAAKKGLPAKQERLKKLDAELTEIGKSLSALVVKGKEEKTKALQTLQDEAMRLEGVVTNLKSTLRRIGELRLELEQRERREAESYERLRAELIRLGIAEADIRSFRLSFGGDFRTVLARRSDVLSRTISTYAEGVQSPPGFSATLAALRMKIVALQKDIGVDAVKERQLVELQGKQKIKQQERARLAAEIARDSAADGAIKETQGRRLDRYLDVFVELARQREELDRLYAPLAQRLATAPPERKNLTFFVRQVADVEEWARRGEELLDLRRRGEFWREPGSLARKAEDVLGEAWRSGDLDRIRSGMAALVETFKDASELLAPTATLAQFADWLFSTDHISVSYGIRYEGTDIERLSPGTRGIVLLILYLALDTQDDRPLVIDQPEENLDPQSVFDVLTGYFREIRGRRQVIVVTHNPNLVVNTDADQVIVARSERIVGEDLPRLSYEAGGLEHPAIRTRVCQVLEGGERAFLERERRYRLH